MNEQQTYQEDEITLKELILKIQGFFHEALNNWKLIIFIAILFGVIFGSIKLLNDKEYIAKSIFLINSGSQSGGISSILQSFGFGVSGGGIGPVGAITDLFRSKDLVSKTLLTKVKIDNEEDFIANHYIRIYELHEDWNEEEDYPEIHNFLFSTSNIDEFSIGSHRALNILHKVITEEQIGVGLDDLTGIVNFTFTSKSEELSVEFNKTMYQIVNEYFTEFSVGPSIEAYEYAAERVDSISKALSSAEYQAAKFTDSEKGLFRKVDELPKKRAQRDAQILSIMLGEALKNYELAKFQSVNNQPTFRMMQSPVYPLDPEPRGLLTSIIIGGFLGGFLSTFYVIGRKIIRETMEE